MNTFQRMREKESNIGFEHLSLIFEYRAKDGCIVWKKCCHPHRNGNPAGCKITDRWGKSYVYIQYKRAKFMAHRVVWLLVNGSWPEEQIDHRDGDGLNNRYDNLRSASNRQNAMNQRKRNQQSGHTGVRWHTIGKKWNARIVVDGKEKSLGLFHDINDAVAARRSAEQKYGYSERHGL